MVEEKAAVVEEQPVAVVVEEEPVAVTSEVGNCACSHMISAGKWAPRAIAVRPRMQCAGEKELASWRNPGSENACEVKCAFVCDSIF